MAPLTTLMLADWLATTAAGNEAMRDSGKDVVTPVIWTFVIFPPETVTETLTFPNRDVPVPEYVPSASLEAVLALAVPDVADAPTTTEGVLDALELAVDTTATGVAAAVARLAAAG